MEHERPGERVSESSGWAFLAIVGSASLFGTTGTALAQVPGGVDPYAAGVLRLLLGGGLLALLALPHRHSLRPAIASISWGAAAVAVYQLGFFWSVTETGVAAGTLVTIGVSPLASRLIGSILGRPAPPRRWYLSAALLIGGLTVLTMGGYEGVELRPWGLGAAALAGSAFAVYTECGARAMTAGARPDATMAALFFGAGVLTAPLLVWRDLGLLATGRGVVVLAHLSFVTLTLAYMAFGRGLSRLPPTTVTMLTIVEPVVATVLAVTVLHEDFALVGWIGAAVVVLGLLVLGTTAGTGSGSTVRS